MNRIYFAKYAIAAMMATSCLMPPQSLFAAGFALKEQSGTALGNAFAGASSAAEDPSYMFFNPATVGRMDGVQGNVTAALISPTSELKSAAYSQPLNPAGSVVTGDSQLGDIGKGEIVPAIYATAQINEQLRLGLGINVPFGLETEYDEGWVGRYHGVKSRVLTVNVNPVVAFNPVPELSLAAGLQVQYVEAELTNAVDFATIATGQGAGPFPAGSLDGFAQVEGDDVALGFTLGALAEPVPGTRIGVGYRSKIDHTVNGPGDFTVPAALAGGAIGAVFTDTDIQASVELPAMLNFGISQDIGEKFTLMAEAQWTEWSSFDELIIEFENSVPNSVTEEDWDDQWFFALGGTYRPAPGWAVRLGAAYDQKPLNARTRTPRIPDNDRIWAAAGVEYAPNDMFSVGLNYTHIFIDDSEVRLLATDTGNGSRGNLDAEYEAAIDIIALNARIRF